MEFREQYGPWALIAGASEGTGASFARLLAQRGLNLVLVARRESPLEALAGELRRDNGVDCVTAAIDLTRDDATDLMAAAAHGREVGLFIFNAGADPNGSLFLDNAIANWDELLMRNVLTVTRACHRFAGPMRARGHGGIINLGSTAGYFGLPGVAVYGASKAYGQVLGEALWAELKPHGVDVLSYVIGRTDTPAHRELMEARGMDIPEDLADPDEVARRGLDHLAKGPVHNWDFPDDEAGFCGLSADERRRHVLARAELAMSYARK